MAKTADYSTRAADFLKQWQTQMTQQMRDPDVIRAMLAAMQPFAAPGAAHDESPQQHAYSAHADDAAIRHLAKRLDAVERTLARFEQLLSLAPEAKNPAGTGRRVRPKPVAKPKRPVAKSKPAMAKPKRRVAAKPKPATKSKPAAKPKRKK